MPAIKNIVLVHGAWGDASHWRHVIPPLHAKGYRIAAVQNPLTSLADDIDRTTKLVAAQDGPTLLVGHSYGGAVITGAGHAPNVAGLVYIAAFAPDEGDSLGSIFARRDAPSGAGSIRPDKDGFLWLDQATFRRASARISARPKRLSWPSRRSRLPDVALKTSPARRPGR
ncbi:MAG: alpha/beta fold hydrolase [Ensifer adhaerens]